MSFLHSRLAFDFNELGNCCESDVPPVIYKYFDTPEDRDSFLSGWLWFSSPNQNRFFSAVPDPFEYRNMFGSFLFEYSLSCSTEILDPNKPNIKIINPLLFVQEVINTIKNEKVIFPHQVSWLAKDKLLSWLAENKQQKYATDFLTRIVNSIKKFPTQSNEEIMLYIGSIGIRRLTYTDKITCRGAKFNYDSVEMIKNARNHNIEYQAESEVRLHINTGDFLGKYNGSCLMHLVQYLKLFCPGISKYCLAI